MAKPPVRAYLVTKTGNIAPMWLQWAEAISSYFGVRPLPLSRYTVSTVPAASAFPGCVIYVSDETGGATMAFSDGTNWRRVQDRNIIS